MKFGFRKRDRNSTNRPRALSADEALQNTMIYYSPYPQRCGYYMPQNQMCGATQYQTPNVQSYQAQSPQYYQYQPTSMQQPQQMQSPQQSVQPQIDPQALPPINNSCWAPGSFPPGTSRNHHVQDPPEQRELSTTDADVQTFVRDNNNNIIHHKTIVTQLNRHHIHTQRVLTNENYLHTFLINNLLKVNDIHHPRVEYVPGTSRVLCNYRQTYATEPARCIRAM